MQIIFWGNWNVGYLVLKKVLEKGICISAVVTNYDEHDKDIFRNKVYHLAMKHEIPVYRSYKEIIDCIHSEAIGFSIAYGSEIMKQDILDEMKIYNFHPACLPYYKGVSPIQWQIKNGENEWGMSCHIMDLGIDTGAIVSREYCLIDKNGIYEEILDKYNEKFSEFITSNIINIIEKTEKGVSIEVIPNDSIPENYKPRLVIPRSIWNKTINEISKYLNRERIVFFAGNRAELGIMFPIILELSKLYYTDVVISQDYETNGKEDLADKEKFINQNNYWVNIIKIPAGRSENLYVNSLPNIYTRVQKILDMQRSYQYKYAFVLGDRIESLGFSLAVFYGKVPLIHIAGGNIANVPYFDTNIRHCISKMASLHLVFSEESKKILMQLGEEQSRICNIGNPSFDYERMGLLPRPECIEKEFQMGKGICAIYTYHAEPFKSDEENLKEYKQCLNGVMESLVDKIIVTYPNHDPGSAGIIRFLDSMKQTERIVIVKTLGTPKFHALMKYFHTIVVGNSSSGLLETTYYMCPALNIGNRQNERERGGNVVDVAADKEKITKKLNELIINYGCKRNEFQKYKTLFGDGKAAIKAADFLNECKKMSIEQLINKRFVQRKIVD